ncbi:hypothetical protein GIB67_005205 [Kingdonia uniflora]|uniref:Cation/H(+) antiporter C-terminal domain-containing protein n=1 Tax=Kingdonia uniflora TaxID=39325 RepID=A0A7J7NNB7_9MAGN|nr:hypothetical protein GIB67_005205 [Kingdonia uniflora]
MIFKVSKRVAFTLGFLMNTKGLVELIVLNIGKDRKVLNDQIFAILVLMALFTTFIMTPIVMAVYKPARKSAPYKHRTIQRKDLDTELWVLVCLHSNWNIPSTINLTESSQGIKRLVFWSMQCISWNFRNDLPQYPWFTRLETTVFPSGTRKVTTTITWLSPLKLIGNSASALVSPNEQTGSSIRSLLGRNHRISWARWVYTSVSYDVVALFFGGRDDREALSYGARMAEHPGIGLTVMRFVPEKGTSLTDKDTVSIDMDGVDGVEANTGFLNELLERNLPSLTYEEKVVGRMIL